LLLSLPNIAPLFLGLCGCQDPIKDAEQRAEIVEKNGGSGEEICAAKKRVLEAHLQAKDAVGYRALKPYTDQYCLNVEIDHDFRHSR
jgi:hypothetical protein